MTYLGQGRPGATQDEMKVLQQICGGENICVFKGSVYPGGNNYRRHRTLRHHGSGNPIIQAVLKHGFPDQWETSVVGPLVNLESLLFSAGQFQFTSQRHLGYPFSATFYVNGIMACRISSCCEYRYSPGFQQGRKSCFRLTRLSGGKPCFK